MSTRLLSRPLGYTLAALALAISLLLIAGQSLTTVQADRRQPTIGNTYVVNGTADAVDADVGNPACANASNHCTRRAAPTAPTFTVNNTADIPGSAPLDNGVCETPAGNGICTLRAAIMKANHFPGGGVTINFGLAGPVTYTLMIPPSLLDDEQTGDLNITNTLTIIGNGAANTIIDGNGTDGVFNVGNGITATISGVTIKNGITFGCAGAGGIFNAGKLTLSNSAVTGNTTDCLETAVSFGGGITNWTNAVLTITNSTVSGNAVLGDSTRGGGIWTAGPLILVNSTVSGNASDYSGEGGGLFVVAAPVTITKSTISGNSSTEGGGLYFYSGSATIMNSTINGNLAENGGGAYGWSSGPLAMTNSTLSSNNSIINGGGIFISRTTTSLFNVTITGNHANAEGSRNGRGGGVFNAISAIVNFQNSIIAGNSNVVIIAGHTILNPDDCSGTIASEGNNIMRTMSGCTVSGGGVTFADPMLGPLANNGGPTQTHAPLTGSPAIDAGNAGGCTDNLGAILTTDQRGFRRPVFGKSALRCDIGAFELQQLLYLPLIVR